MTPILCGGDKTARERFDAKWTPEPNTGCWLWLRSTTLSGYGQHAQRGITTRFAHRHSWILYRGPIPEGMMLDHTCRVRSCVNPDHLRVVTPRVNAIENSLGFSALNSRKTHCIRGHLLAGDNLFIYRNKERRCLICKREGERRRRYHASTCDRPTHPGVPNV